MDLIHARNYSCYRNSWSGTVKYDMNGKMKIHEKAEDNTATHKQGNVGGSL